MSIEETVNNVPAMTSIESNQDESRGITTEQLIVNCKEELDDISSWLQPYQMCNIERLASCNTRCNEYDELLYILSPPVRDDQFLTMFGRVYANKHDFIDFIRESIIDDFPEVAGKI